MSSVHCAKIQIMCKSRIRSGTWVQHVQDNRIGLDKRFSFSYRSLSRKNSYRNPDEEYLDQFDGDGGCTVDHIAS